MKTESRKATIRTTTAATVVLFVAYISIGCGQNTDMQTSKSGPSHLPSKNSPAMLADISRQGNKLLPGGIGAYNKRIKSLKGYPIVVNKWASWCGPCRVEFPMFQSLSSRYGRQIAFLGINSSDSKSSATNFLRELPANYPSYFDPGSKIAQSVGLGQGFPATAFYSKKGVRVGIHIGGYGDKNQLLGDIKRYGGLK